MAKVKKNANMLIIGILVIAVILVYGGNQGWFKSQSQTFVVNQQPSIDDSSGGGGGGGDDGGTDSDETDQESPLDEGDIPNQDDYYYQDGSTIAFFQGTGSIGSGIIPMAFIDLKNYNLGENLPPNCYPDVTLKFQWLYQNYDNCAIQVDAMPDYPTFLFTNSYGNTILSATERTPLILQKTFALGQVDWIDLHPWKLEIKKNLNDATCIILYNYEVIVKSDC